MPKRRQNKSGSRPLTRESKDGGQNANINLLSGWAHFSTKGRCLLAVVAVPAVLSALCYFSAALDNQKPHSGESIADGHDLLFTVVDLPGRGKGLIASRDIQQGELVIREKPLFVAPLKISRSPTDFIAGLVNQLSLSDRYSFYNLSYVNFLSGLRPEDDLAEVALAIFQTNAVAAGERVGVFPRMARLNHGCSRAFNVVYTWREREGELLVHALKNVKKGQELLTTYMDTKKPRHERRELLSQNYGFYCACEVCSLPEVESRISDSRLTMMSELHGRLASWGQGMDGKKAIGVIQRIWGLGEEERYWSERGQLAADAASVAAAHSDASGVREWAQLAIKWYTVELGTDSEQVLETKNLVTQPQRHRAWGTRKMMTVGGPSGTAAG